MWLLSDSLLSEAVCVDLRDEARGGGRGWSRCGGFIHCCVCRWDTSTLFCDCYCGEVFTRHHQWWSCWDPLAQRVSWWDDASKLSLGHVFGIVRFFPKASLVPLNSIGNDGICAPQSGLNGLLLSSLTDIPLERQRRWFKESFDHLLAIADSPQASDAGVYLSSG